MPPTMTGGTSASSALQPRARPRVSPCLLESRRGRVLGTTIGASQAPLDRPSRLILLLRRDRCQGQPSAHRLQLSFSLKHSTESLIVEVSRSRQSWYRRCPRRASAPRERAGCGYGSAARHVLMFFDNSDLRVPLNRCPSRIPQVVSRSDLRGSPRGLRRLLPSIGGPPSRGAIFKSLLPTNLGRRRSSTAHQPWPN